MKIDRWLAAELPSLRVAGDDDTAGDPWTDGRHPVDVLIDVVADFPPDGRAEILELVDAFARRAVDVDGFLVVSSAHPMLDQVRAFAAAHPTIVLVAGPRGPRPPAAVILEPSLVDEPPT